MPSEARTKWLASPAGRESARKKRAKYNRSAKGRAVRKKWDADYNERHPEKKRDYQQKRYAQKRPELLAQMAAYRATPAGRQAQAEVFARWKVSNRPKINANNKRYRLSQKGKIAAIVATGRRRARIGVRDKSTSREIRKWMAKWKARKTNRCYWCSGSRPTAVCHSDHVIPLARGGAHEIGNLCVSCRSCNLSKNAKTPEEWNLRLSEPVLF